MSTVKYPNLFSPMKIGSVEIRNRTLMAPMGISVCKDGYVNEQIIRHFAERSRGGIGAILTEVVCVDSTNGMSTTDELCIDDDKYIPGFKKMADEIHKHGAKVFMEISHAGRSAMPSTIKPGYEHVAPSAVPLKYYWMTGIERPVPRALTIDEIHDIQDKYVAAAVRAKKADYDGVTIHCHGHYICAQFINSQSNIRTDEYGGSIENRFRFIEEIVLKIREACGEDFVITCKLTSFSPSGGVDIEDGKYMCKRMAEIGVDAVEPSATDQSPYPNESSTPFSCMPELAGAGLVKLYKDYVKSELGDVKMRFIVGGGARTGEGMEKAITDFDCDFIQIGRGVLVDAHMVRLIEDGREDEVHPCIGCWFCSGKQLFYDVPMFCAGNGATKLEHRYDLPLAIDRKKVLIIGGGPAGIEAAKVLKKRGHYPVIWEKSDKLGGQMHYAEAAPQKDHFKTLIPYMYNTVKALDIPVEFNKEATYENVMAFDADVVICATGVKPRTLPLPGVDMPHVVRAKDCLIGDRKVEGKRVVIIGGGDVGCEVAEKLSSEGHEVHIVEMTDFLAPGYAPSNRTIMLYHLQQNDVRQHLGVALREVEEDGVVVADKMNYRYKILCDNVVMATGDAANDDLFCALDGHHHEVYKIGDCNGPSDLVKAHAEAYALARNL